MLTIIFIIIVIIILLVLVIIFNRPRMINTLNDKTTYKYSNLREKFKTGDIILFSYIKHDNLFKKLTYQCRTTFLGFEYGHAGLVMKHDGNLYVVECTDTEHVDNDKCIYLNNKSENDKCVHLNNKKRGGIRIFEMDTLLDKYYRENEGHFGVKFISQEIPSNIILSSLKKYENITFENKISVLCIALIDIFVSHQFAETILEYHNNTDRMMCTEFLHRILNEANILKPYPSKLFWPHKINDVDFEKIEKIKFSKIHRFII